MPDRRKQIELLIATRFDNLWFPRSTLKTSSGLAPNKRVDCPVCARKEPGWIVDQFGRRRPCVTCGGRQEPREGGQWRKTDRGKGKVFHDEMDADEAIIGHGETKASSRARKRVKCDACAGEGAHGNGQRCHVCDGAGERDLHAFDLRLDIEERSERWEGLDPETILIEHEGSLMSRRDAQGSYRELELALAGVAHHVNKDPRFLVVTLNHVAALRLLDDLYLEPATRDIGGLSRFEGALLELTLDYIDTRMPDPIRVSEDVRKNPDERAKALQSVSIRGRATDPRAREVRDNQIRAWARQGKPHPWIAQQVGLSDRQLREVINRTKRDRAA